IQSIVVASNPDERDFAAYVLRRAGLAVAPGKDLRQVADNWLENPVDLVVVVSSEAKGLAADLAVRRAGNRGPRLVPPHRPRGRTGGAAPHAARVPAALHPDDQPWPGDPGGGDPRASLGLH